MEAVIFDLGKLNTVHNWICVQCNIKLNILDGTLIDTEVISVESIF